MLKLEIYALESEFYSGQDTHERTDGRTNGLSVILGFALALKVIVNLQNPGRRDTP